MTTPVLATAACLALYVYIKGKGAERGMVAPSVQLDACRDVEHPPNTWSEALYYFKEVFKYMYSETLGRWQTVDLFVGLAYLSHRTTQDYSAVDIMQHGRAISCNLSMPESLSLLAELKEIRRYLLYCRGLKYKKPDQQLKFWEEHLFIDVSSSVLVHQHSAGLLRPAYALIADEAVESIVLCIRGTQSLKDLFTSLAATTKPHHRVEAQGVVLGYGHLGMLAAARWLLKQVTAPLKDAMARYPDYKLRIVGHSMGGGTAVLLTTMVRESIKECADAKCYAIACPACMTLELANSCKDYITSVINGTDIVPTFSAASVDALREDVMHSSWFVEFQRDLRSSVYRAVQGGIRGVGSATSWTTRNILSPAVSLPFQACYSSRRERGPYLEGADGRDILVFGDRSGDADLSLFEEGMRHGSTTKDRGMDSLAGKQSEGPEHLGRARSLERSVSSPGRGHDTEPIRPPGQVSGVYPIERKLSESIMAEALESCLYAAADRQAGGRPEVQAGHSGQGVEGETSDPTAVDTVQTAMQLLDKERTGGQRQGPQQALEALSGQQMKRKLWPWWNSSNEDGMASLEAGPSSSNVSCWIGAEDERAASAPRTGVASSSRAGVLGGSSAQLSQGDLSVPLIGKAPGLSSAPASEPVATAPGSGPKSQGSWLWRGMFRACMAPRPQNIGARPLPKPIRDLHNEYEDEDEEIPENDQEQDYAGGPPLHDPAASSRQQLQAGITAVVSAVTGDEIEEDESMDDASLQELRAAESVLREVEDSSSGAPVADGDGSPSKVRATRSWASFLGRTSTHPSSSAGAESCGETERQSGMKRHLYPAGRCLHFFPTSQMDANDAVWMAAGSGPGTASQPPSSSQVSANEGSGPVGRRAPLSHKSAAKLVPITPGVSPNMAETGSARYSLSMAPFVLYEVSANEAYARIKLCRSMVMDHLTPAYLVALDSVAAQVKAELVSPMALDVVQE